VKKQCLAKNAENAKWSSGGVDPKGETTREAMIRNSMIVGFSRQIERFMMQLSAKRRRAMLASNPFKE
jgi:hypothetical protein